MKYILQHGTHWGYAQDSKGNVLKDEHGKPQRRQYKAGDVVELTPEQYGQFMDKFKSVEVVKAEKDVLAAKDAEIQKLQRERDILQAKVLADAAKSEGREPVASDIESAKNPPAAGPGRTDPAAPGGEGPATMPSTGPSQAKGATQSVSDKPKHLPS
jgi:hypothetical protein